MESEKKYGDSWTWVRKIKEENPKLKVLLVNSGPYVFYVPLGVDFNKEILLHQALNLEKMPFIGYEFMGKGIFMSEGQRWK